MTKVPAIHFDTADLPESERFAHWSAAVPTYDVSLAPDAQPGSFHALVDAWFLGEMVVSTSRLPALRFQRPADKIATDRGQQLTVLMLRQGAWSGDLDGRMLSAGPGQLVLLDQSRPMDVFGSETDSISVNVARAPIAAAAPGIDLHGFIFDGPIGRVLADHLMLLVRRLPAMEQTMAATVVTTTAGLIASCVASSDTAADEMPGRDIQTRHRAFRYIDKQLGSPDLTALTISKQLGMSRSVLYRAFEPLGGIAQYIRARRLEAAHVLLEDPDIASRISDIAGRFGFTDQAHFSRAFRTRYGYNPRRARNGQLNGLDELAGVIGTHSGPDIFRAWVARIS